MGKTHVHDMRIRSHRNYPSGTGLAAVLVAGGLNGESAFLTWVMSAELTCIADSETHASGETARSGGLLKEMNLPR